MRGGSRRESRCRGGEDEEEGEIGRRDALGE